MGAEAPLDARAPSRAQQMSRYGALLLGAGAAVTAAGLAAPHQREVDDAGLVLVVVLAALGAAILAAGGERLPRPVNHGAVALGTVCVSLALLFNGERRGGPAGGDEMYYLWIVLYAAYYFDRAGTAVHVAFVATAYAGMLAIIDPGPIAVSRWLTLTGLVAGAAVVVRLQAERRERLVAELGAAARTDPLTGLANRRAFGEAVARELARARRDASGFALLLADLDAFKEMNDRLGHVAGDRALAEVGRVLREQIRGGDLAARFGGDEFVVLLPDSGAAEARDAGERLARAVRDDAWTECPLGLSYGVAEYGRDGLTLEELVGAADSALYASKGVRTVAGATTTASIGNPGPAA